MLAGKKALLVHSSADLYGSDRCLLWIAENLKLHGMEFEVVLPYLGPLAYELRKEMVPVHIIDPIVFRRSIMRPVPLMKMSAVAAVTVRDLRNLIEKGEFHLVHSNTGVVIGGALAAWRSGIPHIWHFREILTEFKQLWKMHEPFAARTSDAIVCISKAVASQFVTKKARSKLNIVYDGIPISDRNACVVRQAQEDGLTRLLSVGRLAPYKGQDVLLRAVSELLRKGINVELTLVGDVFGMELENKRKLINQAEALNISNHVKFEGFQHDVNYYLDRTDILVVPSRRPEGLGLVILEAMARCRPVVSTSGGGVKEIISDRKNGFLVESDNSFALANCIAELIDSPEMSRAVADEGYETVRRDFSLEKTNAELLKIYERVLG